MRVSFVETLDCSGPALVVGLDDNGHMVSTSLDGVLRNALSRAVEVQKSCGRFTGKLGQSVDIIAPAGPGCRRLVGLCAGKIASINQGVLEKFGGAAAACLGQLGENAAIIDVSGLANGSIAHAAAHIAFGAALRNYKYTFARTRMPEPTEATTLHSLTIVSGDSAAADGLFSSISGQIAAVHHARDLINTPPNILYPDTFVDQALALAERGIIIDALEPAELRDLGMNALLAVGEGSAFRPRLLTLRWNGAKNAAEKPIIFVGKGITFDCGGVNLKSPEWMKGMKGDMAGGAAALAAVMSAADAQLPINIAAVIPLAENAISGTAYRPSDVIVTACGVSVEVMHTDAEGRLALIDAIWYAQAKMAAATIVSIGTLTGSGMFGLGRHYAGLYTSDDDLARRLTLAGTEAAEPLWRLPVEDSYDEDLLSGVADYLQIAPDEFGADGTYVARLLRHAAADVPWAQIEMAGLEFSRQDTFASPKGATGFGSRLLSAFVRIHAQSSNQKAS
jgi:leucyl aminopeptidase